MGADEIEKLKKLLKKSENKTCVDCNTRQPRWASINIGCFVCIRCSGTWLPKTHLPVMVCNHVVQVYIATWACISPRSAPSR